MVFSQQRDQISLKGYGFLSFAKKLGKSVGKSISKNLSRTIAKNVLIIPNNQPQNFKKLQKRALEKLFKALIGNKITNK